MQELVELSKKPHMSKMGGVLALVLLTGFAAKVSLGALRLPAERRSWNVGNICIPSAFGRCPNQKSANCASE